MHCESLPPGVPQGLHLQKGLWSQVGCMCPISGQSEHFDFWGWQLCSLFYGALKGCWDQGADMRVARVMACSEAGQVGIGRRWVDRSAWVGGREACMVAYLPINSD